MERDFPELPFDAVLPPALAVVAVVLVEVVVDAEGIDPMLFCWHLLWPAIAAMVLQHLECFGTLKILQQ